MKNKPGTILTLFIITVTITLMSCNTRRKMIIPEHAKTVISVMKFEDRSINTNQYNPWRMGIPDMIMESLSIVPFFRVISRDYLINRVLKEQEFQLLGATDPTSAVKMGNMLNAQYMVIGSFSVFKKTLFINAKVLSVKTGEIKYQTSAKGLVDSFYTLQNQIALDITKGLQVALTKETEQKVLSRYDTKIVNASLANYKGEGQIENIAVLKSVKAEEGSLRKINELKKEAKINFKKALKYDAKYRKAKENLGKMGLGIPMTL
ncbi:MAG TPA: CsgG/HfaB family protein [Spirochaetota bacterium]|nr:CsgG/HfaB family protein [Spirochaetota bacterium]HPJ33549.1 CsgG/HfaB family protein [Spirochaetota bacterium]